MNNKPIKSARNKADGQRGREERGKQAERVKETGRLRGRQAESRQTEKQGGRQTGGTERQTSKEANAQTERHRNWQAEGQTSRKEDAERG